MNNTTKEATKKGERRGDAASATRASNLCAEPHTLCPVAKSSLCLCDALKRSWCGAVCEALLGC